MKKLSSFPCHIRSQCFQTNRGQVGYFAGPFTLQPITRNCVWRHFNYILRCRSAKPESILPSRAPLHLNSWVCFQWCFLISPLPTNPTTKNMSEWLVVITHVLLWSICIYPGCGLINIENLLYHAMVLMGKHLSSSTASLVQLRMLWLRLVTSHSYYYV